jgi:16S rRNA (cytidine1402-2'-O)-methyltransferase
MPLGNRADLAPRAVATLRDADVVVAEDTRSARRLLQELGLPREGARLRSCFDANEPARATEIADLLRAGKSVALISEAGTPLISDPGFRVVRAAIEAGARVIPVPGPSALLAALVASGLPSDHFVFLGFPPRKSGARRRLFESVRSLPFSIILYESPLRTAATLADLAAVLGRERRACVARELTKPHEELVRGSLAELCQLYSVNRPLGEITLVIAGFDPAASAAAPSPEELATQARALLAQGLSPRDAATRLATSSGQPRRDIYRLLLSLRSED